MLRIHRNPNQKEFLKSCESFLRKSQFTKLRYLHPGFGGPWEMLGIFFVNVIFITLQKSLSAKKIFEFHTWVQKCHSARVESWKFVRSAVTTCYKRFCFQYPSRWLPWFDFVFLYPYHASLDVQKTAHRSLILKKYSPAPWKKNLFFSRVIQ